MLGFTFTSFTLLFLEAKFENLKCSQSKSIGPVLCDVGVIAHQDFVYIKTTIKSNAPLRLFNHNKCSRSLAEHSVYMNLARCEVSMYFNFVV